MRYLSTQETNQQNKYMHWTYNTTVLDKDTDICQGDILEPNEALLQLFNEVHPHFTDKKYRGFLVITQSCDTVRRPEKGNKCSATHINLCVIRTLQDIIKDSLKEQFGYLAPGIYVQELKRTASMLIERIVNQNENSLGLFYLHPDGDVGIAVHSVAILRVAIAVRATEHYKTIQDARTGRLSKEFQPKLGWMVGNLFSRVGVTDWKDNADEEKKVINEILSFTREKPIWLENKTFKKINKDHSNFNSLKLTEQEKIINDYLSNPKDPVLEIINETIKEIDPNIQKETLDKIKTRLNNRVDFDVKIKKYGKYLINAEN